MVDEGLLNFIRARQQAGKSKEEISAELLNTGWKQEDIDAAFQATQSDHAPAAPTPTAIRPALVWVRRVLGILLCAIGIALIFPALIMGTFASDSGTTVAILIATIIMFSPYVLIVLSLPLIFTHARIQPGSGSEENTSGQGAQAIIPAEIRGWNWGAFGFSWIWGLFNGSYITLVMLITWLPIPFIRLLGLVFAVWFGIKGNEWAWRNKHWDSIEHFKRVQRYWAIALLILVIAAIVLIPLLASSMLGALSGARHKAADAARISDMKEIQVDLELYKNQHSTYPRSLSELSAVAGGLGVPTDPVTRQPFDYTAATSSYQLCGHFDNTAPQTVDTNAFESNGEICIKP